MDRFISAFPAEFDRDLMLCRRHGVAWQADRADVRSYDGAYFEKCRGYDDLAIGERINAGRVELVNRHVGGNVVIDVGIGSGEFIRRRGGRTFGHDINPLAIEWLKANDRWRASLEGAAGLTFWDVLEHVETPALYLDQTHLGSYVFASIPVFDDLASIRASKHYRPGEHLQYWTAPGFVEWMDMHGFRLLEQSAFETEAGRESIASFAFRRYRWPR